MWKLFDVYVWFILLLMLWACCILIVEMMIVADYEIAYCYWLY
jgi:hypothetical protein